MIHYKHGGCNCLWNLCKMKGSVFPMAVLVALPCAMITAAIKFFSQTGDATMDAEDGVVRNNAVFAGFSTLVGFLVIFRTSQAYARFWDGCSWTRQMRAEWFDACSSVVAFCKYSNAEEWRIRDFQELLVRLFCMLHAVALAEIEDSCKNEVDEIAAFHTNLIDPDGIDLHSLEAIKLCDSKVELLFQWIQQVVTENINTGVLSIPAPILSRSFQEMANGMIAFNQAIKISYIPFPFPYAQSCDALLLMHWLVVPIVVSSWTSKPYWAALFAFMQVFILWSLNFIAVEIENPFGMDENDLDGVQMQEEMNRSLILLLQPEAKRTPSLRHKSMSSTNSKVRCDHMRAKSFVDVWNTIQFHEEPRFDTREGEDWSPKGTASSTSGYTRSFRAGRQRHSVNYRRSIRQSGGGSSRASLFWLPKSGKGSARNTSNTHQSANNSVCSEPPRNSNGSGTSIVYGQTASMPSVYSAFSHRSTKGNPALASHDSDGSWGLRDEAKVSGGSQGDTFSLGGNLTDEEAAELLRLSVMDGATLAQTDSRLQTQKPPSPRFQGTGPRHLHKRLGVLSPIPSQDSLGVQSASLAPLDLNVRNHILERLHDGSEGRIQPLRTSSGTMAKPLNSSSRDSRGPLHSEHSVYCIPVSSRIVSLGEKRSRTSSPVGVSEGSRPSSPNGLSEWLD